jgi:hypothetical protein
VKSTPKNKTFRNSSAAEDVVTEEFFEKFFCCTKKFFVRAQIHSFQINIVGLERISTLPEEYFRLIFSLRKYIFRLRNCYKNIKMLQKIYLLCKKKYLLCEKKITAKRRFSPPTEEKITCSRRKKSFVAEDILLSLHLLLQKIRFLGARFRSFSARGRRFHFSLWIFFMNCSTPKKNIVRGR